MCKAVNSEGVGQSEPVPLKIMCEYVDMCGEVSTIRSPGMLSGLSELGQLGQIASPVGGESCEPPIT